MVERRTGTGDGGGAQRWTDVLTSSRARCTTPAGQHSRPVAVVAAAVEKETRGMLEGDSWKGLRAGHTGCRPRTC